MPECFFVSDLHGHTDRYDKLFKAISGEPPAAIFLGGDLLPHDGKLKQAMSLSHRDFVNDYLAENFRKLRGQLGEAYPSVFLILGNDDARYQEAAILAAAGEGIWSYIHNRKINFREYEVYGYAMVPPTPFRLKDWERYDVSRFVDPGCISPESGWYTVPVSENI
ncbi:MAG: metallophosphoesterase [Calditrichia bacterium]